MLTAARWITTVAGAVAVVLLAWVAFGDLSEHDYPDAGGPGLPGWNHTWSDEFDGAAGAPPDSNKWMQEVGGDGWGNQELQYYTLDEDNALLNGDSTLSISAQAEAGKDCWYGPCRYTSARLITQHRFSQRYGRFEARLKVPVGKGLWPAFWMLGDPNHCTGWPECGEIDVMENVGSEPNTVYGTVHGPSYQDRAGVGGQTRTLQPLSENFHVFTVEWEPEKITWFLDGSSFHVVTAEDLPDDVPWVFDHPFYLLLNVAVGGTWPGDPAPETVFPQRMVVDYVRVYERAS